VAGPYNLPLSSPPPSFSLPPIPRWVSYPLLVVVGLALIGVALAGIVLILTYPQLPSLEALTDYQPKIPLRVFTADGHLIGEFGEERRALVRIQDVPPVMKQAILAAEDERFYQHPGIDTLGVVRAAYSNLIGGGKRQGASTITMQVARNFFLSSEKTLTRKVYEVLLAFKIEHNLSKDEILQLYINQIYLGQRAYGFGAAAQIYYGKSIKDLSIAEAAMLAGLPKAPSSYNPVANPKRAKQRQSYVLRRMRDLGYISDAQMDAAKREILIVKRDVNDFGVKADFVAEMARELAFERFPEDVYTRGLRVITTVVKSDQDAAYAAVRKGVMEYDRRHGYRGAEGYVNLRSATEDDDEELEDALQEVEDSDDLLAAIVLSASPKMVRAYLRGGTAVSISGEGLKFASHFLDAKAPANKRIRRGAIIRVVKDDKNAWAITELPDVEAAFVSASPTDGSIRALVGGFDFNRNKFNHVSQAWRQPGSSIKPFIYSAAMEKGYTPASVIPDEPVVVSAEETGSQVWEPKNYDGKYDGPITLRMALARSKNMVSIRLLQSIGPLYAQDYLTRFGFDADKHPPYLTMALGAGSVTPWQHLAAYAVFANGGYRIQPHIVREIQDDKGNVLARFDPPVAGDENLRAIDARNAYILDSMMHDVARYGTGALADARLKRTDLAGKTGTTNDYVDAWFCGYHPTLVGIAWIGFDQPRRLGSGETGSAAALPIWIAYMEKALKGIPESYMDAPHGLVSVTASDPGGKPMREFVYSEQLPPPDETPAPVAKEQEPAPVQEAKPKPIEAKPSEAKPGVKDAAAAVAPKAKPADEKPAPKEQASSH
jgi:penicillin-binding protein 1A